MKTYIPTKEEAINIILFTEERLKTYLNAHDKTGKANKVEEHLIAVRELIMNQPEDIQVKRD